MRLVYGGRVPPVLDGVLRAAGQQPKDARPRVAPARLRGGEDGILSGRPAALLERRVEMVQPALAALLGHSARHAARDLGPLDEALADALDDEAVLGARPRPLREKGVVV